MSIATPYVDKIWDLTGETIHLVSYEGGYAYYLLKKENKYPLQMRSRRGDPNLLLRIKESIKAFQQVVSELSSKTRCGLTIRIIY